MTYSYQTLTTRQASFENVSIVCIDNRANPFPILARLSETPAAKGFEISVMAQEVVEVDYAYSKSLCIRLIGKNSRRAKDVKINVLYAP